MRTTVLQRTLQKGQKNVRLSAMGRGLCERLALLDGLTESNLFEILLRREAERRGINLVGFLQEMEAAPLKKKRGK